MIQLPVTRAAVAVAPCPEHDVGHFEGSETGQAAEFIRATLTDDPLPFITAALADTPAALREHEPPHIDGSDIPHAELPAIFECARAFLATCVEALLIELEPTSNSAIRTRQEMKRFMM